MLRLICCVVVSLWIVISGGVSAKADPLLTVELPHGVRTFTLEDLQALENVTFTTTTIWTEGEQTFTGVPLRDLMAELGLADGMIEALAINDYSVTIPVSEALADGPVVAFLMNGKPMSVRNKGPLWIVYPYSTNPKFQNEVVYSRSVWQLERIIVEG